MKHKTNQIHEFIKQVQKPKSVKLILQSTEIVLPSKAHLSMLTVRTEQMSQDSFNTNEMNN